MREIPAPTSRMTVIPYVMALVAKVSWAQANSGSHAQSATVEPSAAPQLLDNNEVFRVQRFDLRGITQVAFPQERLDTVIVAIGNGISLNTFKSKQPEELVDGDVRFLAKGSSPSFSRQDLGESALILIELKPHWPAAVTPCHAPKNCSHPIRAWD